MLLGGYKSFGTARMKSLKFLQGIMNRELHCDVGANLLQKWPEFLLPSPHAVVQQLAVGIAQQLHEVGRR